MVPFQFGTVLKASEKRMGTRRAEARLVSATFSAPSRPAEADHRRLAKGCAIANPGSLLRNFYEFSGLNAALKRIEPEAAQAFADSRQHIRTATAGDVKPRVVQVAGHSPQPGAAAMQ